MDGLDALEGLVNVRKGNLAIEDNAGNVKENFIDPRIRAIVMKCKGKLIGQRDRFNFDRARDSFLHIR